MGTSAEKQEAWFNALTPERQQEFLNLPEVDQKGILISNTGGDFGDLKKNWPKRSELDKFKRAATGGVQILGAMTGNPWLAAAGAGLGAMSSSGTDEAVEQASQGALGAAKSAEALNRERYTQAQDYMEPYIERSDIASRQLMAELGLSPEQGEQGYMEQGYAPRDMSQVPGYQGAMDEALGAAEQSAISSGSTAYGGRRLEAAGEVGAGVQQSYYSNYMNMLQNLANPTVATNLAGMGIGQGQSIGQQNIAAQNTASDYNLQGVAAQNAKTADFMGGLFNMGTAYMGRPDPEVNTGGRI